MKLTSKFIIAFIFIVLIPIAFLGYLSYHSAKDSLQDRILEGLTLVAEAEEGLIYSFFEVIKGRALNFSSDGFIRDSVETMKKFDAKNASYLEEKRWEFMSSRV